MEFKAMKIWVVVILMIMLIGSEVECISNSQEFKSMKLPGPLCEAKCDFVCARVGKIVKNTNPKSNIAMIHNITFLHCRYSCVWCKHTFVNSLSLATLSGSS